MGTGKVECGGREEEEEGVARMRRRGDKRVARG